MYLCIYIGRQTYTHSYPTNIHTYLPTYLPTYSRPTGKPSVGSPRPFGPIRKTHISAGERSSGTLLHPYLPTSISTYIHTYLPSYRHRSMEIQLTDFENAAFTVFVILLTRIITAFDLSLYIPLSKVGIQIKRTYLPYIHTYHVYPSIYLRTPPTYIHTYIQVDDNMKRAHQRDGLLKEKFWFRKHLAPPLQTQQQQEQIKQSVAASKAASAAAKVGR